MGKKYRVAQPGAGRYKFPSGGCNSIYKGELMEKPKSKLNPFAPSNDEVKRNRLGEVVRKIMDYSLGTLWWVDEGLWQEQLASRYDQNSTRVAHPGLSMLVHPVQDLYSQVPMLHGSSRGYGVKVKGLTAEEPERIAFFGPLLAPVTVAESVPDGRQPRMRPNSFKSRISPDEEIQLEEFLKRWGLST